MTAFERLVGATLAEAVHDIPDHPERYARVLRAKRRRTTVHVVVLAVGLAGAGTTAAAVALRPRPQSSTVVPLVTPSRSRTAPVATSVPFNLYTHCGVQFVTYRGRTYETAHPLVGAAGSAPAGWADPYQAGRLIVLSPTRVRFTAARLPAVDFEATSASPAICE
jgi:hypothetical protein